jgi:hypothetical protein
MALHHHDPEAREKMRSEGRAWHAFRATATPEQRDQYMRMIDEGKSRAAILAHFGRPASVSADDAARQDAQEKASQASALWDSPVARFNERFR